MMFGVLSPSIAVQNRPQTFRAKRAAGQAVRGPNVVRFSGKTPPPIGKNGLWVSVERIPAKVGGLGEVSKTIPEAFNRFAQGRDMRVLIPYLAPMKAEDQHGEGEPFAKTGLSKTLIGFDGQLETFELLQTQETAKDGTKTWVYAIANDRYFGQHANLYFPKGKPVEGLGDDAIFKAIMMFNRAAAAFAPELNATTEAPGADKLARFDGDCDFVMVHDWLSSSFLAEIPEDYRDSVSQLFMLHNTFDEYRAPDVVQENRLRTPEHAEPSDKYSPLSLGIQLSDGVIANFNYARTLVHTNLTQGHRFVKHLQKKLAGQQVYDMHHGIAEDYAAENNAALREDGFTELKNRDWIAFKQQNRAALQEKYGLKPDPNAVIMNWVARFDPNQKGFYLVLNEMEDLLKKNPNLQLIIAGTTLDETGKIAQRIDAFKAMLESHPDLKSRITFPGFVSKGDVVKINAGSDFSILPSLYEPYGLTQLEAIRLGAVPIVHGVDGLRTTVSDPSMRTKGPEEKVWEYGQTGVLMKPLNVADYRKAIGKYNKDEKTTFKERFVMRQSQKRFRSAISRAFKLAKQPEVMHEIRESGNRYIDENHNWQSIVERYTSLIDEVVARKQQPESSAKHA